jgi:hypothetical protein
MFGINLRVLRFFIGWMFAISSLICVVMAFWLIHRTFEGYGFGAYSHLLVLLLHLIFPLASIVFGIAWWTIWKERTFSRFWGIAASVLIMVSPIRHIMLHPRMLLNYSGMVLAFGIIGLLAFSMRDKDSTETDIVDTEDSEPEANPS